MLQELALFERMQRREAKRKQHASTRGSSSGSARRRLSSTSDPTQELTKAAKITINADDGRNLKSKQRNQ